ncbi:MATE family efflux transporter [Falcatimonas sp. MSJ-15]|uniref:MATE family efflux transporter n=1 Tax=Falcatimonas sp. MSJ-15 TaxID=2841515 RepID=UPI001C0F60AC|nr:MATE family efflux transporter [Falcatimonas sp. MSJ-15]MBU5469984.1 MATE family efflux transporter [Falcatimonas sp. MSJ-15]
MKEKKKYEMDMCNGPIISKMLIFAIPLMCSSILQLLFNAADIVVVGKFAGDNSLGAVGSTTALINLLVNLFMGLSVGANVLAARDYGGNRKDELSKTVHTSMMLSIISGIILTFVGVLFSRQILILMKSPDEILPLASLYLKIYFIGMPASMAYNFGSAILRSVGDTKRPLYFLFAAGIVNVILNLIFVIVFNMDVAGVALATIISQYISAFLVIRCLMRESEGIKLHISKLKIHKDKLMPILRVGIPAGFQGVIFSLSNVVIQSSVNIFGNIIVSGNSAAQNIEGFIYVGMNAFYQAAISFTSQNMGAGKKERVRKIAISAQILVILTGLILGLTALFSGRWLLRIYTNNPEVIEAGMKRMIVITTTYFLCGMMDVMVGIMRGLGYSIIPMIVSLVGACGLRLIWIATVFQIPQYHNVTTVYVAYPISWAITFTIHVITYIIIRQRLGLGKK